MWQRTLTIGSAGKTFSITGWKIGWIYGPVSLIRPLKLLHQNCINSNNTLAQEALAVGFEHEIELHFNGDNIKKSVKKKNRNSYWFHLVNDLLEPKRDRLASMLTLSSSKNYSMMIPIIPDGGYFMVADFSKLDIDFDVLSSEDCHKVNSNIESDTKDYKFVKWLLKEKVS